MTGKSEQVNDLFAALSKAQGEMETAEKGGINPHFGKSYSQLSDVWAACRGPLAKHGLSVIQTTKPTPTGVCIITTLGHSSGQWIQGELTIIPDGTGAQKVGAAITYGRRFALMAMIGVAPEDDDGESIQAKPKQHPKAGGQTTSQPAKPQASGVSPIKPSQASQVAPESKSDQPPTRPDGEALKRLYIEASNRKWTGDQVKSYMKRAFDVESSTFLTLQQYGLLRAVIAQSDFDAAMFELHQQGQQDVPAGKENAS